MAGVEVGDLQDAGPHGVLPCRRSAGCSSGSAAARSVGGDEVPVRTRLRPGFEELVDGGEVRRHQRRVVEIQRVQRQSGAGGAAGEAAAQPSTTLRPSDSPAPPGTLRQRRDAVASRPSRGRARRGGWSCSGSRGRRGPRPSASEASQPGGVKPIGREAGACRTSRPSSSPPLRLAGVERPELGAARGRRPTRPRVATPVRPATAPMGPPVLRDLVAALAAFVQPCDEIAVDAQRRAFPRPRHDEQRGGTWRRSSSPTHVAGRPRGRRRHVVDRDDERRSHAARTLRISTPRNRP